MNVSLFLYWILDVSQTLPDLFWEFELLWLQRNFSFNGNVNVYDKEFESTK